jgi:hypothetical protein
MRRIILFIDELYAKKSKLFTLSEKPIEEWFFIDGKGETEEGFMV